jgi:crotonobetainyl-CoA:carnitine CoA-transferase CaiB-like acyl-CoA transferase
MIALNLARADDRELLPALFEVDAVKGVDEIASLIARSETDALLARGVLLGLAIADAAGEQPLPACTRLTPAVTARRPARRAPRVLDLSALWAGPLAGHLLWLAGAEVTKVESRSRPDSMRGGDFFALLNQGKASVAIDFDDSADRAALIALIARSDIVIEASRPRALEQFGIHADNLVQALPGLTWITITGHGTANGASDRIGFGDDCGVAAGLSKARRGASGRPGFVGDAIGDPLTGIRAAGAAWAAWASGQGGRIGLAMSGVVAEALAMTRARNAAAFDRVLIDWAAAEGEPFPIVPARPISAVAPLGADTRDCLVGLAPC